MSISYELLGDMYPEALEYVRGLEQRIENFERYVEREIEPRLLAQLEQAQQERERIKKNAEAAQEGMRRELVRVDGLRRAAEREAEVCREALLWAFRRGKLPGYVIRRALSSETPAEEGGGG